MYRMLIYVCAGALLAVGSGVKAGPDDAAAANQAAVNVNAAVDGSSPLTAGSIVKDAKGATVGKIERVVGLNGGGDRVVLRIGSDLVSIPAERFNANGKFVTTTATKAELRALARAAGG